MSIIEKIVNWKEFKNWKARKEGKEMYDYEKGAGYYISVGFIGINNKGKIERWHMESGKVGIFKLLDYTCYRDPSDMIENSWWQFLGYEGEKLLSDMTFNEFLEASKQYNFKF